MWSDLLDQLPANSYNTFEGNYDYDRCATDRLKLEQYRKEFFVEYDEGYIFYRCTVY